MQIKDAVWTRSVLEWPVSLILCFHYLACLPSSSTSKALGKNHFSRPELWIHPNHQPSNDLGAYQASFDKPLNGAPSQLSPAMDLIE